MKELSLDPEDWPNFESLAQRIVSETLEHLRTLRDRPAWQDLPDDVRRTILDEPLPLTPQGEEQVYEEFVRNVLPYRTGNLDPRFFGWVQGPGVPLGNMADLLASALNPHLGGFNQAPAMVETKVIDWMREAMGFPEGSSGLLLSGGSMANITALTVARNAKAGFDVRKDGLQSGHPMMTVYGSTETHAWAKKAVELLGIGNRFFSQIGVDDHDRIDLDELEAAIRKDLASGHKPIAILGTAGTVNTGATDDLDALADLAAKYGLWFHIDGAFGALAAVSHKLRHLVEGLERADSVAFDLHKWMYLPFEVACVLIRDSKAHLETFSQEASYIATSERGVIAGGLPFAERGLELTRSFKALKAWMCLKAYGLDKFAALIEQNVEQAQFFAKLVEDNPELELMAPVALNVVCYRFKREGLDVSALNALNQEILLRIQEQGVAVPSSTVRNGEFCQRVCVVNHRTRREDLEALVEATVRVGREVESTWNF